MRLWLTLLATATLPLAADPLVGTWKPDIAKWKLSPGAPDARKHETITLEPAGKNAYRSIITTEDGTKREGDVWHIDGKEHLTAGPGGATITSKFERRGGRVRRTLTGPNGKTVSEWSVTPDGGTLTVTTSGRALDEVLIYTKQ